jgi:hypothetical protein
MYFPKEEANGTVTISSCDYFGNAAKRDTGFNLASTDPI